PILPASPPASPRTGKSRPGPTSTQAPTADGGKRLGRQVQGGTGVSAAGRVPGWSGDRVVSWQVGQVVGGRRPWPRTVGGGPAGCWCRGRQNAGGGPRL